MKPSTALQLRARDVAVIVGVIGLLAVLLLAQVRARSEATDEPAAATATP